MKTLDSKVCVVTGGTAGIGREIARQLALEGAQVVLVGREPTKGAAVASELSTETKAKVEFVQADLLSKKSIDELGRRLATALPRIDVLINNAGGAFWERGVTSDGIERSLALNLLAPFQLTNALLPLLERSAPARVINVATKPRKGDLVDLGDLQSEKKYDCFGAYGRAKTGLIMMTYEFARRLEGRGITVNCLHPGVVTETNFSQALPAMMRLLGPVFARVSGMRASLADAADTAVYLATAPELASTSGKYFVRHQPVDSLPQTYEAATAAKLWASCESLLARGQAA